MGAEIDFVVKLGGSAITDKEVFETLKSDAVEAAADVLTECFRHGLRFVVAHGAGSYGHHSAKVYGVAQGYKSKKTADEQASVKLGFAITWQSVHKLNRHVVERLIGRGIPAVGISPCPSWTTDGGRVTKETSADIERLVSEGFVPVIHGDAVLDSEAGCSILSADTILEVLCWKLSVKRAVFLMDCDGVYTCSPELAEAKLIPVLEVRSDGSIVTRPETSTSEHDTTGGILFKMKSAINIVCASGGKVGLLLCSLRGNAFEDACMRGEWSSDSVGTRICLSIL